MDETGPIQLLAIVFGPDATGKGRIVEMLFLMPAFGAAAGAATDAVAGKLREDTFIKEAAGALEPGRAAVFALAGAG
ncbi:DUF1269 domain-containing protein [Streptomyces sp. NPDC047117]|uniref:DUF1269 domain-containing protein n=1 Tax=Streptomyces sp. NPDC047117 TaxID=3155379 RepID=UPI00340F6812